MDPGTIARSRRRVRAGLLLGALTAALAMVACETLPPLLDCGALPDGNACPTTRGGTCDDPSCSALYTCSEAGWAFVQRCDGGAGGTAGAAGSSSGGAAGGVLCEQAMRDPACPALQAPDCDEASARACPTQACLGQCDVFLTCTASGWAEEIAGYCDEGELVLASDRGQNAGAGGSS